MQVSAYVNLKSYLTIAEVIPGKIAANVISVLEAGADPNSVDNWVRLFNNNNNNIYIYIYKCIFGCESS
jgi:hypothetical protein